jgi:hypothetical protein
MKKLLFTLIAIFTINLLLAQDYRNSLSIGFGASSPLGEFGSRDVNKATSGAAVPGTSFNIQAKGFYSNHFGVFSSFNYQSNLLDYDVTRMVVPPGSNYYVKSDDWVLLGTLVGLIYEYKTKDNTFVHPKIGIGFLDAYTPEIQVLSGYTPIATSKSANAKTVCGIAGFDVGWDYQKLRIQCHYDFLFAKPSFSQITYDQYNYPTATTTFSQNMVTQNIMLSLGIRLK